MADVAVGNPITTYGTKLSIGLSSGSYTTAENIPIKDYPELIGTPNLVETTTLSDSQETNTPGIGRSDVKPFTCNFSKELYSALKTNENTAAYFKLELGDKPSSGTNAHGSYFTWQGKYTLGFPGKGVDEAVEFTINVTNTTPLAFTAASGT